VSRAGIFASAVQAADALVSTFQGAYYFSTNSYTKEYTNIPLGAAGASRRVVVAVAGRNVFRASSVTVGGVSLSRDARSHPDEESPSNVAELWSGVVPTGTSATITVVTEGSQGMGIGVWTLSQGAPTGDKAAATSASSLHTTLELDAVPGDFCIATVAWYGNVQGGGAGALTWDEATERYDEQPSGPRSNGGADAWAAATTVDFSVSFAHLSSTSIGACAAAYR